MPTTPLVRIHYRRPPEQSDTHEQHLVHDAPDVKVTFVPSVVRSHPLRVDDHTVLENGSAIVWFTFPGAWHDIGRFHTADGVFTGIYANILTPVELRAGHVWDTTDLFLDLWLDSRGPRVLDEDEFDEALARGWLDAWTGARARREVELLRRQAEAGLWPPTVVKEWTLARARRRVEE